MLQTHLSSSQNDNIAPTHVVGTCFSTLLIKRQNQSVWVLDSGTSTHVSYDCSLFINLLSVKNMSFMLPTKTSLIVQFMGDIYLTKDMLLLDVVLVPEFEYNQ